MQNRMNYTLALDPSLSETGYALMSGEDVIDCGTLKFGSIYTESFRLKKLAEGLKQLIYKFGPKEVAIEVPFVGRNAKTAIKLGGVRGVILELAEACGLVIYEYTTFEIKGTVTDDHCADKEQVRTMVALITGIKTDNYNVSDAIAVGLCHSINRGLKETPGKMESTRKAKGGVHHVI